VDPSVELIKLPYLFANSGAMYRVLEGPIGKKLFAKVEQKGIAVVDMVSSGDVAIHNSKHPLKAVDDFKGLKLRSYGPMGAACIKAFGAIAVVSVPEEMYSNFQTGILDGGANPATVFYARKLYDVQKYVTSAGMFNAALVFLLANKAWWDGLPQDIRAGLSESIQRLVKEQRMEMEAENKILFEQIAAKGSLVHYLTQSEQTEWKKALQTVYTEYAPKLAPELLKDLQQEAEKWNRPKN
jgi:C4-dicarboxylate-binding protein DctP